MQFADGAHIALEGEEYRNTITVTVGPSAVRFAQPADGQTMPASFDLEMEAIGLVVEPSGEINEGAGHFHILVDTDFIPAGQVIPTDERHLHFGQAQTSAELQLPPGEHTLRLQFADGAHIALEGEAYRDTITVTVGPTAVRFAQPADGQTVPASFDLEMEAIGLVVEPSGEINEGAGHFHILVNTDFIPAGQVIPTDERHLHFGQAQTSAELDLPPGEHTLRLQFADGAHIALEGEEYRDTITVTVGPSAVRFAQPADGQTVPASFDLEMEAIGLVVEPSGEINEGAGHFHILVNTDFIPAGEVIPTDERHLHFGQGQTSAELQLPPGEHTLRLQFADGAHIALEGDAYRDTITVVVEEGGAEAHSVPSVRFAYPPDGQTVTASFAVVMEATGLVVEPSGEINEGAGHFHILVNTDFIPAGQVIPTDERHLHFGQGQTTAELQLPPGEHTLRLQFADGAHIALEGDAYRDTITVVIEGDGQSDAAEEEEDAESSQGTADLAIALMTETGCNSCHVTPGLPVVDALMLGPDQTYMGDVAATRRVGYSAEEYIREAIVDPSAFIVEECPSGPCLEVMPANYGDLLKEDEINAIVAYLASLTNEE